MYGNFFYHILITFAFSLSKIILTALFLSIIAESVLTHQPETETSVAVAVAKCLKYAPDRIGGGGRRNSSEGNI